MKLRKDYLKPKLLWRLRIGNKEVQKSDNFNLNDCSFIKRIYGHDDARKESINLWRIGNEEQALSRKLHKRLPRN